MILDVVVLQRCIGLLIFSYATYLFAKLQRAAAVEGAGEGARAVPAASASQELSVPLPGGHHGPGDEDGGGGGEGGGEEEEQEELFSGSFRRLSVVESSSFGCVFSVCSLYFHRPFVCFASLVLLCLLRLFRRIEHLRLASLPNVSLMAS